MRGREQMSQTFDITQHLAKEFARYVNRVQNDQVDILGSFLIAVSYTHLRAHETS